MEGRPKLRHPKTGLAEALISTGRVKTLGVPQDDWTREHCPHLWEMLTLEVLSDQTIRVLPTLLIERVRGGFRVTLQDHASRQAASAEADGLGDLWEALEAALVSPKGFRSFKSRKVTNVDKRDKLPENA